MRGARAIVCALAAAALLGPVRAPTAAADGTSESVRVQAGPAGRPLPAGYVSFSFEYRALHQYTGRDPDAVNPVLLALLRQLAPGGTVLRIGGNSTDQTWWPQPGAIAPGGVNYALSRGWLRVARALAADTRSRLLLGLNLAANRPALAATEARALLSGIGRSRVAGFEIGNEPDLYPSAGWFRDRSGRMVDARGSSYSLDALAREFRRWRTLLPGGVRAAGPALATLAWGPGLPRFLAGQDRLAVLTLHRYPLRACTTDPTQANYPSIANLLAPAASRGLAAALAPYVALAHAHHAPFRLDELNSASCRGAPGVSDTFASALWLADTLFALAANGVDGVNLHTLPGTAYQPFGFARDRSGWHGTVSPLYYGALLFSRAFPPGARLLPVAASGDALSAWATIDPAGRLRVTLINKGPAQVNVELGLPGGAAPPLATQGLGAPSVDATSGVTLAGQRFDTPTTTGTLAGRPSGGVVWPVLGTYGLTIAPYSALLLSS